MDARVRPTMIAKPMATTTSGQRRQRSAQAVGVEPALPGSQRKAAQEHEDDAPEQVAAMDAHGTSRGVDSRASRPSGSAQYDQRRAGYHGRVSRPAGPPGQSPSLTLCVVTTSIDLLATLRAGLPGIDPAAAPRA